MNAPGNTHKLELQAMIVSLSLAFIMLVGKGVAFFLTDSTAVLADFSESVAHLLVTGFSAYSVWLAAQPPDEKHLYGHDRVVVFSITLEAALILATAAFVMFEALKSLVRPQIPTEVQTGIAIIICLTLMNTALAFYLKRTGKRIKSEVLLSNGQHIYSDVWTSVAALVGLGLVALTGIARFDGLVALLASLQIFWSGSDVLKRAVVQGMDTASQKDTQKILHILDQAKRDRLIEDYHQLRHRNINQKRWIEVHLIFEEEISLREGHRTATEIETRLKSISSEGTVSITTHLETTHHLEDHPRDHEPPDALA